MCVSYFHPSTKDPKEYIPEYNAGVNCYHMRLVEW